MRRLLMMMLACLPAVARAGGLEFPGNGTVAVGRGAAFTAKADDATALEYNVAGLARQRGTRLLLDVNVLFSRYEFQRAGNYPDNPANPSTPWGGKPFPLVRDQGGPFAAPFLGLSTDFGVLDRWTFAVGVYGPSSVGNRTYPLGVDGLPSPARYDLVQAEPLVVLPTLAVAVRLTRWLDLGVALHVPVGHFDLRSTSFTDLSSGVCPNPEYQPCDAGNHLIVDGATATASLGLLVRPSRWIAFGLNVRAPFTLHASGTVHADPPKTLNMPIPDAPASFSTSFPTVLRAGLRFVYMKGAHEAGDLEADVTWENWSQAQGVGPQVSIPELSVFQDIHPTIVHHYHDTVSARLGGQINVRLPKGILSLRSGVFYDQSATAAKDTRLDFDTLDKIGVTGGLSYAYRGFGIHLGYAVLFDAQRTVTDGDVRPINGAQHGEPIDDKGNPLPPVNNGVYSGITHILSLGVTFAIDELRGSHRNIAYHADYEAASNDGRTPAR